MMDAKSLNFHASRVRALDGVRGIAILLVFAVHTSPALLAGGRIGVDLFFVLSGFLISSILLQEFRKTGTINLGYFYMRRALRLLPALFSVIAFVVAYVWINKPDQLTMTLDNAVGAAFYFFNWLMVTDLAHHQWMFSHLWSLSVEEQFYIAWPLVVLLLFSYGSPKWLRFAVVIAGIAIPSLARAIAWTNEHSLHLYFRTDLRFDGLMWGALAALLIDAGYYPPSRLRIALRWIAPLALIFLFVIASFDGLSNGFLYLIGFSFVGMLSSIIIYSVCFCSGSILNAILEIGALRWIGTISYGLYLWHWPIILIVTGWHKEAWSMMRWEFCLTFLVATLSFYFYERPFLRLKDRFTAMNSTSKKY
jgi:peptidoglycan/LPS O-acetylase OafA/YrhL